MSAHNNGHFCLNFFVVEASQIIISLDKLTFTAIFLTYPQHDQKAMPVASTSGIIFDNRNDCDVLNLFFFSPPHRKMQI